MSKWFMLNGDKHHRVDEGIHLHYSDTCDVVDAKETWATGHDQSAPYLLCTIPRLVL